MQVTAFATPARPSWRWRIVDDGGETVEESSQMFSTIAGAVAEGARRMDAINSIRPPLHR